MADSDTIFALATPPGRSALAVFRISGPRAGQVLQKLTGRPLSKPRLSSVRWLLDPDSGARLDEAIAVFFRAPASFTGQDCVELSTHGSAAVVGALVAALSRLDGVRAAEPGEFTRRAHMAGKIDLSQAEAIADLIDSETEFQRRQAVRLLEHGLGKKAEAWRGELLTIAVELESALDFSDEGDVDVVDRQSVIHRAQGLLDAVVSEIELGRRSMLVRNGFTVVIAGPPNVGKSTLFNTLAGSEIAIVTEHAGTTRDLLRASLNFDGVPVTIIDSAGLRETTDPVEAIGIDRARQALSSCDLLLSLQSIDAERLAISSESVLNVWSKSDLHLAPEGMIGISNNDSDSILKLMAAIRQRVLDSVGDGSQGLVIRERHASAMRDAAVGFERLIASVKLDQLELAAEECRSINACLGRLSGAFETEELLGEIFGRFCIGK